MASLAGFNPLAITPAAPTSYEPIPAGDYLAYITESDIQPLVSGNGNGLNLTFEVIDGPHKGRKIWEKLSIVHTSPKTQQIAQEQLSAICHATGVLQPQDTAELHMRPLTIVVAIRPADAQYKAKNTIKGYKAPGGVGQVAHPQAVAAMQAPAAPFQAAPNAAPATPNRPAWAKAA